MNIKKIPHSIGQKVKTIRPNAVKVGKYLKVNMGICFPQKMKFINTPPGGEWRCIPANT